MTERSIKAIEVDGITSTRVGGGVGVARVIFQILPNDYHGSDEDCVGCGMDLARWPQPLAYWDLGAQERLSLEGEAA